MDEILKRQEYCGDVLNFKTHSKSFKNHRRIDNPKEEWLVFEDKHEAIIDRSTYNKVQKMLGKTKHRAPKEENGPKSIFSDLLRCADCGSKLWYHTNTQNKDIHYFSCSNYVKDYRGSYLDVSCDTKKPSFVEDTRQGVAVEYVTCEPISDIFEEDTPKWAFSLLNTRSSIYVSFAPTKEDAILGIMSSILVGTSPSF